MDRRFAAFDESFDEQANAYFYSVKRCDPPIQGTFCLNDSLIVDIDYDGQITGIEYFPNQPKIECPSDTCHHSFNGVNMEAKLVQHWMEVHV